ncbi:PREDICTED: uncharacterized protein LOC105141829 [Populus euphratica]|uniref:Uncharacterized protein LOC105141829 n=1 Tax=Populus euphratica TaxID=75702 RepID=A0AAJ6VGJ6_POPEU|nr:PREDICTED: uncharacterized protein LOC105141829 [Populus euphratica]XP_011047500.1 PREDICTED: uncharacterized protein LOC105141829 [Populus euphratica]
MVRFSCFNAHIPSHKPKKTAELSVQAMHKSFEDFSQIQSPKTLTKATSLILLKAQTDTGTINSVRDATSSVSAEQSWESDKIEDKMDFKNDIGVHQTRLIKKSQSLGSGLCHEGMVHCDNDTEEETGQGFSGDSLDQNGLPRPDGSKDTGRSPTSVHEKDLQLESVQMSFDFDKECIFSIGNPQHSGKEELEISDFLLSGEGGDASGNQSPGSPPMIEKSCSFPDMGTFSPTSHGHLASHSRSFEDLHSLNMRWKTISINGDETHKMRKEGRGDCIPKTEGNNIESCLDEGFDSYNYSAMAKDWIMPVVNEANLPNKFQGESSTQQLEELPSKDFKMKRIADWLNNLQHCSSFEEPNELPDTDDPVHGDSDDFSSAKVDSKVTPVTEAAKRYISSLTVSATTAHLSNLGLAEIPFLSAFSSMRMLNLSGNSIVRITAGALPRGLHVLNLSKNSISSIEGLRELTRLRVLDLSYNRIFRIGHGLASCSSLKELYLAGNKISEVEGLHRLLKLTVLDLRFNKISTTKCLGQLAANYNSLQAISLEGNPAQKNVGDEQLKKYLQGLLPHLVYFNRQPTKASTLKDAADRSVRLGISSHQFDRGLRSENKAARKASHSLAGARPSSSSTHARKSHAVTSPKRSRGRHLRLPPNGAKTTSSHRYHHNHADLDKFNYGLEFSFHRSRSEGTLGAC